MVACAEMEWMGLYLLGPSLVFRKHDGESNDVSTGLRLPVVGVCWRAPIMDGFVPGGTVVADSHDIGREQPGPSRSAPFLSLMNCADMLRFSLLADMCVCACPRRLLL